MSMPEVFPILVPQLIVNDDAVVMKHWLAETGAAVRNGEAICEVETSKALQEMEAEHDGIIWQIATPEEMLKIGDRIGLIGPSLAAIQAYLADEAEAQSQAPSAGQTELKATPKAQALAEQNGVSLAAVAALGVRGTIKEADVIRYLAKRDQAKPRARPAITPLTSDGGDLPDAIQRFVDAGTELSRHEASVAQSLHQSLQDTLLTTIEAEVDLTAINEWLRLAQEQGIMLSLLHVVISALGRSLPACPRLLSFHHQQRLYRYQSVDIAFVTRAADGRLYTPVVRQADQLDLKQIAQACYSKAMSVHRGKLKPADMEGAAFTVSHIAARGVTRFVALPHRFQSAILAVASGGEAVRLHDGQAVSASVATLTLSYDHVVCDGVYAADFLTRLIQEMEKAEL